MRSRYYGLGASRIPFSGRAMRIINSKTLLVLLLLAAYPAPAQRARPTNSRRNSAPASATRCFWKMS